MWTAEIVKQEKPAVEILLLGKKHPARLSFCSPRIATATITHGQRALEQYEFPWEMLATALNAGEALVPLR